VALYGEMTGDDGMTNSAVLGYLHTPLYVSSVSNYVMYICQYSDKMKKQKYQSRNISKIPQSRNISKIPQSRNISKIP
jgi:uncharacterized ion transporter superfamily protein YfcC